jgi:ABC-type glycerol-3-phosphate transport system permease component
MSANANVIAGLESLERPRRRRRLDAAREVIRFAPSWVTYVVMVTWFVLIAAPIVWLIVTSLRTPDEYRQSSLGWPGEWAFSNYAEAWETANFSVYVPNTIIYTLSIVACVVVLASMAGYGLARFKFRGRGFVLIGLLIALAIPFNAIMFSVYDIVDFLGLLGTRIGVIIPAVALSLPFGTFYMRAFFTNIPDAISEAAKIDGAGEIAIFFRIMLPLASPGIATLAVFAGVWSWGMYLEPLLLASSSSLRTVALGLGFFTTEYGGSNQPLIAAAVVTIIVPLILVSIALQRRFVEGMTAGAVK